MPRPENLTPKQREVLSEWEPVLRESAKSGDLQTGKHAMLKIQQCLRETGHEARLMSNKAWLFEAAMESRQLTYAITGFTGIRQKVDKRSVTYRKATALLAICHIRDRRLDLAKPLISEALKTKGYSGGARRCSQIRQGLARIFQEEALIAELRGRYRDPFDDEDILARAGHLVQTSHDHEILEYLGNAVPAEARERFAEMLEFTRQELPSADRRLLPGPEAARTNTTLGERTFAAIKRVVWSSLCDEGSPIHQVWCQKGVMRVAQWKMTVAAIFACLQRIDVAIAAFAVSVTALIIKGGLEAFCQMLPPSWIVDV